MQKHNIYRTLVISSILFLLTCFAVSTMRAESSDAPDHVVHVATTGNNSADCGGTDNPCRTLQHAVNRAANEQWVKILVAGGVYTRQNGDVSHCDNLDIDAVACIINRRVQMIGGYSTDDWTSANPQTNPTIIDGQQSRRGIMMLNVSKPDNTLTMTGFTIRNGLGSGISSRSGNDAISGFGGGIFVDSAGATLRNLRFENNKAIGHNRNSGRGGSAVGGGLALRGTVGTVVLDQIVFVGNRVEGGSGSDRGGYAIGGGLYTYRTVLKASNIFAEGNIALAGTSKGSGVDGNGELADAQGGALAFHLDSDIRLSNAEILNNQAIGGAAPSGNAGGAFGGGIFSESATIVTIVDTLVRGNVAAGGNGVNSDTLFRGTGFGNGGGMRLAKSSAHLERVSVIDNLARGGTGARYRGSAGGGGLSFTSKKNDDIKMVNVVVAGNRVEMGGGPDASAGGGGGGIWIQGNNVVIDHSTIAGNELEAGSTLHGTAMGLYERSVPDFDVLLRNSIVAQHETASNAQTIWVKAGNSIRFLDVMLADNGLGPLAEGEGTVTGRDSTISVDTIGFLSPGAPNFNYRLAPLSPAIDAAPNSNVATDHDNEERTNIPDIGAFERSNSFLQMTVTAAAADKLHVRWQADPLLRSFRMSVTCSRGASPPDGGSCDSPMLINNAAAVELTGLTPYRPYTVGLEALDDTGTVVAVAKSIRVFPTDKFVYLPLAAR